MKCIFTRALRLPAPRTETFFLRVIGAPKFYFADVGMVNQLARRGELQPGAELYGRAFENWVFHELSAHNAYTEAFATLSYWRLAKGILERG